MNYYFSKTLFVSVADLEGFLALIEEAAEVLSLESYGSVSAACHANRETDPFG